MMGWDCKRYVPWAPVHVELGVYEDLSQGLTGLAKQEAFMSLVRSLVYTSFRQNADLLMNIKHCT
jgi:hypothetical protein